MDPQLDENDDIQDQLDQFQMNPEIDEIQQKMNDINNDDDIYEIIYARDNIHVNTYTYKQFVRDYNEEEIEIIRSYFIKNASKVTDITWCGNINTSSFMLCLSVLEMTDTVESIRLGKSIGVHGMKHMCDRLENNTSVTTIIIDYTIDIETIQILGKFLETNTTIKTLKMMNYAVEFKAIKMLCQYLKNNYTITNITLLCAGFGTKGAQILPWIIKSPLESLNISGNTIGGSGAKMLSECLMGNTSLTHLILVKNSVDDAGMAAITNMLKINKTLTHIDLNENPISDKSIKNIVDMLNNNMTLTSLFLNKSKISAGKLNQLYYTKNFSVTNMLNMCVTSCSMNNPLLVKWLDRNKRLKNSKETIYEFEKIVETQLPEELLSLIRSYY
jgi:hypothetical protein